MLHGDFVFKTETSIKRKIDGFRYFINYFLQNSLKKIYEKFYLSLFLDKSKNSFINITKSKGKTSLIKYF